MLKKETEKEKSRKGIRDGEKRKKMRERRERRGITLERQKEGKSDRETNRIVEEERK